MSYQQRVILPSLYKYQQEIIDHPARFKIVSIGRRAGKSHMCKQEAIDKAVNYGQTVWLVYPSYNTASAHWREILAQIGRAPFITYKNMQEHLLEFKGGGSITIKSGDKYHNLRGSGLDLAVLDEAAFMDFELFAEVIGPSLMDRQGRAFLISTPYGKNWFYDLWRLGQDGSDPEWKSWQMPSTVNPKITQEFLRKEKRFMPEAKYRQEYLAQFEGTGGGVFNKFEDQCVLEPLDGPELGHSYVMGVDWGRKQDFTVISVFDMYTGDQVSLERFNQIGWDIQSQRVTAAIQRWKPAVALVEQNSIGDILYNNLKDIAHEQFPYTKIRGFTMSNTSKRRLVETFAAYLENGRVRLLSSNTQEGAEQISELSTYESKLTNGGNMIGYQAKRGTHDDCVIADIIAASLIKKKKKVSKRPTGRSANIFFPGKVIAHASNDEIS